MNLKINFNKEEIFNKALKIRAFENILLNLFSQNIIGGTTHTCIGQELSGILVGFFSQTQDIVISNHRCHGHYLGLTDDFEGLALELIGSNEGVNFGIGGSQHIALPGRFYSNGIQGGMVSYSAGIAKVLKNKKNGIVYNFIGDGTFGEGALYEGLNLASVFNAPVLFFVENNNIAQTTKTNDVISGKIIKRFESFDIECIEHSHDDIDGLSSSILSYTNTIRELSKPKAIIWNCNRLGPHSKSDDTRNQKDINEMWSVDILKNYFKNNYTLLLNEEMKKLEKLFARNSKYIKKNKNNPYKRTKIKINSDKTSNKKSITFIKKINQCLYSYLDQTEGFIIGEDIAGEYGGAFKATKDLYKKFPNRIINTPISESGIVGFAMGSSSDNCTIIVEIMFGDFLTLAVDQIINHASKFSILHQENAPSIIIRTPIGGGRGYGATHSQSIEKIIGGFPNIYIEHLSFLHNIDNCYNNALNRFGCTIITEPKLQYSTEYNKLPKFASNFFDLHYINQEETEWLILNSDGKNSNITLVCTGISLPVCIKSAEELFLKYEISVNIVSPVRTSPLSIPKDIYNLLTNKILIIDETHIGYGFSETFISKVNLDTENDKLFDIYCLDDDIYPSGIELEKDFIINSSSLTRKAIKLNEI